MTITSEMVKELREKTGCGMMDCKKALAESGGDMAKAMDHLRKKGLATAAKKAERVAAEGIIESYIHMTSKLGVMLELNCETDFVARNPEFKEFARDIAMQICAASPMYVSRDRVAEAHLNHEKEIIKSQSKTEGKPEHIIEKMLEGRLEKFYSEVCLLDQSFVKDPDKKIGDLIKEKIAKFGENIVVKRFVRYQVGEKI